MIKTASTNFSSFFTLSSVITDVAQASASTLASALLAAAVDPQPATAPYREGVTPA